MAEIKKIKVDGVEYDIASAGGLYTQYLKFNITGDNDTQPYSIIIDTFKPINHLEEFRNYIKNRIIYSDTPTFTTTFIRFTLLNATTTNYLAFGCAYYGSANCQIVKVDSTGTITTIIASTNISAVLGRITEFEVLATIKS